MGPRYLRRTTIETALLISRHPDKTTDELRVLSGQNPSTIKRRLQLLVEYGYLVTEGRPFRYTRTSKPLPRIEKESRQTRSQTERMLAARQRDAELQAAETARSAAIALVAIRVDAMCRVEAR